MNYGLQIPQLRSITTAGSVLNPSGDWSKYLPVYEPQFNKYFDTNGCAVWGWQNAIETMFKFRFPNAQEPNFSERFTYIMANITPPSADVWYVADIIKHYGLIDQSYLPMTDTLEDFMKPKPMTGDLILLGQEFLQDYSFNHFVVVTPRLSKVQQKSQIKSQLRSSPVCISVSAWHEENGVYVDKGLPNNHWVVCYGMSDQGYLIFDSYDHSLKTVSYDHNIAYAEGFTFDKRYVKSRIISLLEKLYAALIS